jgi:hypothetical protein
LVITIRGLRINKRAFNNREDLLAKLSGFTAAIVLGVISEKISIQPVNKIAPSNTLPPK